MVELNKTLIIIAGPTAVGKTALSLKLAQHYNCPIISFDSRQFYNEMTIGTAKPNKTELETAEHHFINSRSIDALYTAGMFEQDALSRLKSIFSKHDTCIAVGGSGLYINGLAYGIDDIPKDEAVRENLKHQLEVNGISALQQAVQKCDPAYYQSADIQNPRRLMRALEVFELTGKPYSSFRTKTKKARPFKSIWIGLELEMEELYERINLRVDQMLIDGLLNEAKALHPLKDLKALKTVGYMELFDHFDDKIDYEEAVRLIKRNSRHYAKRQLTWFRKNEEVKWFKPSEVQEIINYLNVNK